MHWDWFSGEEAIGLDPREFIHFYGEMSPPFEETEIEEDAETVTYRDAQGRVRKALKEGSVGMARMSMDQYLDFPVHDREDWKQVKKRMQAGDRRRYEAYWPVFRAKAWRERTHPLIFGPNTSTMGFYWTARELMGTEGLSVRVV